MWGDRSEGTKAKAELEVPVKRRWKYIVGYWSLKLKKTSGLKINIWKSISMWVLIKTRTMLCPLGGNTPLNELWAEGRNCQKWEENSGGVIKSFVLKWMDPKHSLLWAIASPQLTSVTLSLFLLMSGKLGKCTKKESSHISFFWGKGGLPLASTSASKTRFSAFSTWRTTRAQTLIGSDWSPTRKGLGRQTLWGYRGGNLTWF